LEKTVPLSVKKLEDRLYEVEIKTGDKIQTVKVNTILVAIGRDA
jgi:pyruvate/2-oxoglutarate dehydrogenase complex dihydrolipoamide dehydrogenase (E3) component